jgi:PAS domain S-box-containing protein
MGSDMASMQIVDDSRDALRRIVWRGFDRQFGKIFEWNGPNTKTSCAVARRLGHRVIVPDVETCDFIVGTPALDDHRKTGIRAVQSTPLVSRVGCVLGVISTHWYTPHQPSERDLGLLDVLARQAADLIERKQTKYAAQQLAAIVASSEDAIKSKDLNGIIISWNAAAERLFGYTAQEAIVHPIAILIPTDRPNEEPKILSRIRRGERIEHYETTRRRKDGSLVR